MSDADLIPYRRRGAQLAQRYRLRILRMLAFTANARWSWPSVHAFLSHTETAAVSQVCRAWSQQLLSLPGGATQNLVLNGSAQCASLLARASTLPRLCHSIRSTSFEFCNHLQNFDLVPLGKFTNLTSLNLNACRSLTDSAVEIVAERCHNLRRLELYWCVVMTDIGLGALANAACVPSLTHLNLSGLKHVTDATFVPLARRASRLRFLDLTRCEGLRDESLRAVGETCRNIETLLLYATPNMTDRGFEALAPGMTRLTHLDLTGMKLIGDAAIIALAKHAKQLRVLHLMWVTALTDASLVAIGSAPLRHLTLLSIHGNVHVTDKGLERMAQGCPDLETIDVNGCKLLGPYRTREGLQRIFPKLKKMLML